jgi:glycosyltransferase involved in cell wall biosynthesis
MFSVVIPLYNKEKYILRAVESVLSQSFADFELIIVDDGSVDSSLEIVKSISDSRIRIIQQSNQGVSSARNKGMSEAKYDWIAFLDGDDAWASNHLNELKKVINISSSLGMVATKSLKINTNLKLPIVDKDKASNIRLIDYFLEASAKPNIVHSSAVAINKKVFHSIGGFSNIKVGEDLVYWVKVALYYPVAVSDKVTSYYFTGTGGVMEKGSVKALKRKNPPDIALLEEASPPITILFKESIKDPSILENKSVIKYINSILFTGVKMRIYNEDFSNAKRRSKLAIPQLDLVYIFFLLLQITALLHKPLDLL